MSDRAGDPDRPRAAGRTDSGERPPRDGRHRAAGERADGATVILVALMVVGLVLVLGSAWAFMFIRARIAASQAMAAAEAAQAAPTAASEEASTVGARKVLEQGLALMSQFDFVAAQERFNSAAAAFASAGQTEAAALASLNAAIALMNQSRAGAQEEAIAGFGRFLAEQRDHPERARAHYGIGLAYAYLGQPEEALRAFEAALRLQPDDGAVHYQIAQALEQMGRADEALERYERAIEIDPFQRSALLGIQRLHARAGRDAPAEEALRRFMALEPNPRSRLTEFKYTRMGRLSEAIPLTGDRRRGRWETVPLDPGVTLDLPEPIPLITVAEPGADPPALREGIVIPVDLDGDGRTDLFVAGAADHEGRSVVLVQTAEGRFRVQEHPLASLPGVRFAAFADFDDDGRVDALVVTSGAGGAASRLMRQREGGSFEEAASWSESSDALWVDLDHDGDLDLVLAPIGGPPLVLMNRGTAGFEALGERSGLSGLLSDARRLAAGDLNGDGLLDLVFLAEGGCQIWLNDGFWNWRRDPVMAPLELMTRGRMVISEHPATGRPLVIATAVLDRPPDADRRVVAAWLLEGRGSEASWRLLGQSPAPGECEISLVQLGVEFAPQVLISGREGAGVRRLDGSDAARVDPLADASRAVIALAPSWRPALVEWSTEAQRIVVTPGEAPWSRVVAIDFRGRVDPSQSMRSNSDGVGTRWAGRAGGAWTGGWTLRDSSGPGQGRQTTLIGIGRAEMLEALFIDWPDGVVQSEMGLKPGTRHQVVETQRQISSCPVIFAWDGRRFAFQTDCLGVGGMGYLVGVSRDARGRLRPEHAPPRPRESVRLEAPLAPIDGAYEIRLTEPMEEACYLDSARLFEWRMPIGWHAVLDERMGIHGPEPSGELWFYREHVGPIEASIDPPMRGSPWEEGGERSGVPATELLAAADHRAIEFGAPHPRFIGRLREEGTLTLTFPIALDARHGRPALVLHGWVEYPYSQTSFAMWQEDAAPRAPSIDALDPASGEWVTLIEQIGYPAGMTRESLLPLTGEGIAPIPTGCTTIRLRTTVELYLDQLRLVWIEPCPDAVQIEHPLRSAEVAECGYPRKLERPQKRPEYDYGSSVPLWDCRTQPGFYTRFGDCTALVRDADGALAIFGPGEEVRLRFDAGSAGDEPREAIDGIDRPNASTPMPLPPSVMILQLEGWCKDMDRYTGDGASLEPLPRREGLTPEQRAHRDALHRAFNTRLTGGR